MPETISEYAKEHGLHFSTDPNPKKYKTKVMAFLKKQKALRFVSFMEKIDQSNKSALKILNQEALKDVRSNPGTNYQGIMHLLGDMDIRKVTVQGIENLVYKVIPQEDQWKLDIPMELSDVMNGDAEVEGFNWKELEYIFESVCVS
jgi:hypothetical protein